MRAVWKGHITFGLVNVPVAVYPATGDDEGISFKQLRQSDHSRIKYKKVAEVDDEEVPAAEIVKGYEFEKGQYVVLTEEDFASVEIKSTHTIEIAEFVDEASIPTRFFYKPYFLQPDKGGDKTFALLHRAMTEEGKVGIAKVAIRQREYLAAVKPDGLFLMLELMHFAHEVRDPAELKPAVGDISPKELAMAKQLIGALSADEFDPTAYKDTYGDALKQIIDDKIAHRPHEKHAPRPTVAKETVDILAILKRSIESSTAKPKKTGARKPAGTTRALVTQRRRVKG